MPFGPIIELAEVDLMPNPRAKGRIKGLGDVREDLGNPDP